ncbi:hypothetical protein [Massilia brevitalea]|uniref:hypothetical protein n=1 Tax=Massilia brevitalea TaxID=442526 RepID=UPI0027392D51|nr:hypothetical protein [Massilia brevitalea]
MANGKTVFVVGAGASFEMGLPVGAKLKEQISSMLKIQPHEPWDQPRIKNNEIFDALRIAASWGRSEFELQKTVRAAGDIAHALPLTLSIDNYLNNHNSDEAIELCGKLAIARAILAAEAGSTLRKSLSQGRYDFSKCADSWLTPFVQFLSEDCNLNKLRDRLGRVAFIVFNYDRCIEQFLMHAVMAIYKVAEEVASEIVSKVEIYHPYGTVGTLNWDTAKRSDNEIVAFGEVPTPQQLLKVIRGIKTFTEGTDDRISEIMAIRSLMETASRIVFLGFAYHKLNIRLLLGDNPIIAEKTRPVFGTAYGMSLSDTQLVADGLGSVLNAPSIAVRNDLTCCKLFSEYSRTLNFV